MELKKDIKCKVPIVVLLAISLIFILINAFSAISGSFESYLYVSDTYDFISDILLFMANFLEFVPCLLLLLYVTVFYKKDKLSVLVFISFCLNIVIYFLCILGVGFLRASIFSSYEAYENRIFEMVFKRMSSYSVYILIYTVPFVLLAISSFKGMRNKALVIIGSVIGILLEIYKTVDLVKRYDYYFENDIEFYNIADICGRLGFVLLFVAILVFGLNNTIPSLSKRAPKAKAYNAFPQQPYAGNYYTAPQQPYAGNAQGYYTAPQQPYTGNAQGYYTAPQQPYSPNMQNYSTATQQPSSAPEQNAKASPKESLLLLKDLHDSGIITTQEYQMRRAEIISKL